jgi:hypothetical protein
MGGFVMLYRLARTLLRGSLFAAAVWIAVPMPATAVPSFARQTKLACSGCHLQFPVLNEFGRQFKLNGYTQIARETLEKTGESGRKILDLPLTQQISVMFQTDFTSTAEREPGSHNNNLEFPDELGIFFAGRITPKVGTFMQVTYSGVDDKFGMDNTDIRIADNRTVGGQDVVYGLSLNNNPTVTDPWNSTPVWGYPYAGSPSAPTPAASPLVMGGLEQEVAGATVYAMVDDMFYAEAGAYGPAPLGVMRPLDRFGTLAGAVPYWRVAVQKGWGANHLMVGHYGLYASVDPDMGSNVSNSKFTDLALDFQYQRSLGSSAFQLQGSWIYEHARYDAGAGVAENSNDELNRASLDATYFWGQQMSFTVAPFYIFGSRDMLLYAPGSVAGSANSSPESSGVVAEVSYNPWMNTRLTLQYTNYFAFNGRNHNYDGVGRRASDNNTVFLQFWGAW